MKKHFEDNRSDSKTCIPNYKKEKVAHGGNIQETKM